MIALRSVLLIALLALVAFGPSVAGTFHFDDYSLFSDPAVTQPSGWYEAWAPLRTRPLSYVTFWIDYHVWGLMPAGYHLWNVSLHVLAACLLFACLIELLPRSTAFLAAALFAVHPLQAEAVCYVFARGGILMTVFCLLSWRYWLRHRYWSSTIYFTAALLAKEECVAFPLFLLLLNLSLKRSRSEWKWVAGMCGLSAAAGVRALLAVAATPGAEAGIRASVSTSSYLAAQGIVILRYLRLAIVPWGFTVDPDIPLAHQWLCWLAVCVLAAVAAFWFARLRHGFWFLAGLALLLPSSSIFAASDLAADRRMYLPMMAFATFLSLLFSNRKWYTAAGWVAVGILTAISVSRTLVWQTEETLWREAVERSPAKARPRVQLARALPPSEALPLLQSAKSNAPADPVVASELGRTYLQLGSPQLALTEYGRALALEPSNPRAIANRAAALLALHQTDAAREDLERALRLDPCLAEARVNAPLAGFQPPPFAECRFTGAERQLLRESH